MNQRKHLTISIGVTLGALIFALSLFFVFTGGINPNGYSVDKAVNSVDKLFTSDDTLAAGVTQADIDNADLLVSSLPASVRLDTGLAERVDAANNMLIVHNGLTSLLSDEGILFDDADFDTVETVEIALAQISYLNAPGCQIFFEEFSPALESAKTQLNQVNRLNASINAVFVDDQPSGFTTRATKEALLAEVNEIPNESIRGALAAKLNQLDAEIAKREASEADMAQKLEELRQADEKRQAEVLEKEKKEAQEIEKNLRSKERKKPSRHVPVAPRQQHSLRPSPKYTQIIFVNTKDFFFDSFSHGLTAEAFKYLKISSSS